MSLSILGRLVIVAGVLGVLTMAAPDSSLHGPDAAGCRERGP